MNTKLSYMYRDANNYKQWEEIVFAGVLKDEEKLKKIKFIDGEFFIPGKVDLPDLQEPPEETGKLEHVSRGEDAVDVDDRMIRP